VIAGLVPARGIDVYAAICSSLDLLVCNDSGAMHIASAVGVPTVSFHSLGDPKEWAPQHDRAVAFHAPHDIAAIPVAAALEAVRALRQIGAASPPAH
jgi:ADP-heptose:LPS heptosyltransferase